jgi:predicted acetyltransferase
VRVGAGVRLAERTETDRLAGFCADVFQISSDYFQRRWRYDPGPASFGLVLEADKEVLGYAHVFDRQLNAAGQVVPCAGLANVAVAPDHRGRGYASVLVDRCLDEAAGRGFQVSLLFTHIPGLYRRHGYQVVATGDFMLEGRNSPDWFEVGELTHQDRLGYARQHGSRPGTLVRDDAYWEARAHWLPEEGWRIFKHRRTDGYCLVLPLQHERRVDEATGGCASLLRQGAPLSGSWHWRMPAAMARGLAPAPTGDGLAMIRPVAAGFDVKTLASPEGVLWAADAF